ncbi:MAG: cytochrome c [Akkermansiaceae bacterium]|nr:cytochrome c [Akkermansiaceae bacterium]
MGLLAHSGANAQKGSRKGHENIAKIAPDRPIPAAPVLDVIDAGCHGKIGEGLPNLGPTLAGSDWVTGDTDRLTKILLHGLTGPIKINGKTFTPVAFMPGLAQNPTISDKDMADVLTYIRAGWSNRASQIPSITSQRSVITLPTVVPARWIPNRTSINRKPN